MKKLTYILTIILFLLFIEPVKADKLALSTKSIKYYGIGVINMPRCFNVYEQPDENSNILRKIAYDNVNRTAVLKSNNMKNMSYITYIPSENIALLTVDSFKDDGWFLVFLNQETGEKGWIFNPDMNSFYTYKSLFYTFGKKYGVRIFNDLPEDKKVLYAKQSTASKKIEQLSYPKYINTTVILGNWMLVAVNDMSKQAKIGWFNWRNEDGSLNMFPNFKEQL